MEKFTCEFCKATKEGKSYKYRSSDRKIQVKVCAECHKARISAMQKQIVSMLGESAVSGTLKE